MRVQNSSNADTLEQATGLRTLISEPGHAPNQKNPTDFNKAIWLKKGACKCTRLSLPAPDLGTGQISTTCQSTSFNLSSGFRALIPARVAMCSGRGSRPYLGGTNAFSMLL